MRKKLLSLALIVAMLVSMAAFSLPASAADPAVGTVTVKPDKADVPAGGTVTYTVTLNGVTNLWAVGFKMNVPEGLTYTGVTRGTDPAIANAYELSFENNHFLAIGFGCGKNSTTGLPLNMPQAIGGTMELAKLSFENRTNAQVSANTGFQVDDTVGTASSNTYCEVSGLPVKVPVVAETAAKPLGFTVSGKVASYNPGNATTVQLVPANGVGQTYSTTIAKTDGSGLAALVFTINDVAPGTYNLVFTKAGHLSYTMTGVVVGNAGLTLAYIPTMLAGDITGDGYINAEDLSLLLAGENFGKTSATANKAVTDLDGDGFINAADLSLLLAGEHFGKENIVIVYPGN